LDCHLLEQLGRLIFIVEVVEVVMGGQVGHLHWWWWFATTSVSMSEGGGIDFSDSSRTAGAGSTTADRFEFGVCVHDSMSFCVVGDKPVSEFAGVGSDVGIGIS
jgi:hypothetical protein